jgi:Leucine-rich repeat (LRR) protein
VTDAGAALLPKFTGLKRLDLSGARVSVKALEYAATLPALEALKFNAVPLEDPDVAALKASPALSDLSLGGTSISDSSFESLAALQHLRILNVSGNDQVLGRAFTDLVKQQKFGGLTSLTADTSGFGYYGLFEIGALHGLEHLSVCRGFVGDDALKGLEKSTSLKRLHLNENVITDAGMPSLKRLTQLEELWLAGNPAISDFGLKELRGLKRLKELRLDGTRCTPAGVKELKEQHLKTTAIYYGGQKL